MQNSKLGSQGRFAWQRREKNRTSLFAAFMGGSRGSSNAEGGLLCVYAKQHYNAACPFLKHQLYTSSLVTIYSYQHVHTVHVCVHKLRVVSECASLLYTHTTWIGMACVTLSSLLNLLNIYRIFDEINMHSVIDTYRTYKQNAIMEFLRSCN